MADTLLQTPYATAMPFVVAQTGGWTDAYDAQRLSSYDLYDDLYNNDPSTYRMMLRGSDEKPIYVPTAKRIVKSLARYVGKGWGFKVLSIGEALDSVITEDQILAAQEAFGKLFARERLLSKYRSGVPEWLRRGDWCWFITADPTKREGSRISVRPIDPRRYFPRNGDINDLSRVTGQDIIEETMIGDKVALLVQTWVKYTDPIYPDYNPEAVEPDEGFDIAYGVQAYDSQDFGDASKRKALAHPSNLPLDYLAGITQLPVYHIKNNEGTDDPFGRSDLSGLETLVAGINQAISDEDLSLAMSGLGMYWTDSGAPVDEATSQPTSWKIGPARVVEVDVGTKFNRVQGITTVQPFQDHVNYIEDQAFGAAGLSDVSVGTADNVAAESGVALSIRFSPTIDEVRIKDEIANGVMSQMFHDLKEWFVVYEGLDLGDVVIVSETDAPESIIPFDRSARWKELMEGVTSSVFTPEYVVGVLESEFGYEFPAGYLAKLTASNEAKAAALDPFAARSAAEVAATGADPAANGNPADTTGA